MNFSSIRFKLIVGGMLTVLIPMVIVGYVTKSNSTKAIIQLSKVNGQTIAESVAMQIAAALEGELRIISSFASRTQVKSAAEAVHAKGITGAAGSIGVIRKDLEKRFEPVRDIYVSIFITDAAGTLYAEAGEHLEELKSWDIAKKPFFLGAKTTRKPVSDEIVRLETQESVIALCAPIISDSGTFLGVFGVLLKASVLTELATSRKIGETGYCFLVNASGIMTGHPDANNVLRLDLKTVNGMENISTAMMAGKTGAESYVFKGIDKIAGFAPVNKKNWSVAATQNCSEVLASVSSLINNITIIILLSIVVASLVIFVAAKSITRPLNKVIYGLKDIARGKDHLALTKRIAINSVDEIGILSGEFNSLMESINNLSMFKKVIEEDESLDDVYQRLGRVFTRQIGFNRCYIYQMTSSNTLQLIYPEGLNEAERPVCSLHIFDNCDLCKAKRTGHDINSIFFPDICKPFENVDGWNYYCFPIVVGGATVAVVQFVFEAADTATSAEVMEDKLFKAEQYINESLAVIETKRLMSSLRDAALIDTLTGLNNRRYLQEYTEKIVAGVRRRGKSIGLIMCDLDYFKQVNDTYGHHTGDLVLKESAHVILQSVREADIVIRFGGEEFLVVLLDILDGESMNIAEKIRSNIEQLKIKLPGGVIEKTISLGVSEFPADTETLWSCIKYSDVALYRAKEEGRNRCVRFTKDMWQEEQV